MIRELSIQNFRSIRNATLHLGRFTVLTGANNSGKSSVLYALQVLKNVVSNPNRSVDGLLNLGFLNLGGLEEVVFEGFNRNELNLDIQFDSGKFKGRYGVGFSLDHNLLTLKGESPFEFISFLPIEFPISLDRKTQVEVGSRSGPVGTFDWDGLKASNINLKNHAYTPKAIENAVTLPVLLLNSQDINPTQRGFTKPIFNSVSSNENILTEDDVARLLASDKKLHAKVASYFQSITGKLLSISLEKDDCFSLQVRDPDATFSTNLVNQGLGTNQIIFLLTKILYSKNRLIGIDEPEIHLHPTLMEQFVRVLVEIAKKGDKQFVFSTHSEHWLMSLLAEVYEGHLSHDDLKVYYLQKEGQETTVEAQQVQPNGQLEGGLKNFLDAQMRLANRFFAAETA